VALACFLARELFDRLQLLRNVVMVKRDAKFSQDVDHFFEIDVEQFRALAQGLFLVLI